MNGDTVNGAESEILFGFFHPTGLSLQQSLQALFCSGRGGALSEFEYPLAISFTWGH